MRDHRFAVAAAAALLAGTFAAPVLAQDASGFESPGLVPVDRYLSPEERAGAEWRVAPEAPNDGLFNLYTVESRFGSFQARGRSLVGFRVKEVDALVELDRISKTAVFAEAVARSATSSVRVVVDFAQQPTETLQGVSGGVKRMWSKTKFQAKEVAHDARETVEEQRQDSGEGGGEGESKTEKAQEAATSYARKYLGLSGAERRWYAELGVDPYTDNQALRAAIKEVSRVEAAANFGMRFAGLPSIPGAREIGKVMDLVWTVDPWELRRRNRELLLASGLSQEDARAFEDNEALSPTLQTLLLQSLVALDGVEGRRRVIERAIEVEEAPAARLLATSTALLVRYHQQVTPLAEILAGTLLPVARAADGRLVGVISVDHVFWTAEVAAGMTELAAVYAGDPARIRELRVAGDASERVRREAGALGWQVLDRWQIAAPEDRTPARP